MSSNRLGLRHALVVAGLTLLCAPPRVAQAGLAEVLARIDAASPALAAARAQAAASRAGVAEARGRLRGEVEAFARDVHYNDPRLVRPIFYPPNVLAMPFDDDQYQYGATLKLPLDVSGALRAGVRQARAGAKAATARAEDTRLALLHQGARLYRALQKLSGQRAALVKQRDALQTHLKVATHAVELGRMADVERMRIATDVAAVRGRLAEVEGKLAATRARLAALMDQDGFEEAVTPPQSPPPAMTVPDTLPARPDLVAADAETAAGAARERQARRSRWPRLALQATVQHNDSYDSGDGDLWQVVTSVQVPLWDGGQRRARVARAAAARRGAERKRAALRRQARSELVAARANWQAAQARTQAARAGLALAEETARVQADRFRAGRLSAADLVDAEAALAKARATYTSALTDWWSADDALQRALGRPPRAYSPQESTP